MSRWFLVAALAVLLLWSAAWLALAAGLPGATIRGRGDRAAAATVAFHAAVAGWLRWTRLRPTPGRDPAWAGVQAEKHRRKGTCFATWGAAAALGWALARPGGVGGLAWLVAAGNLGFQPGLLAAECLAIAARGRLGGLSAGSAAGDGAGSGRA